MHGILTAYGNQWPNHWHGTCSLCRKILERTRYHMVKIGCTVAHQEEYDVFLKIMINTVLPYDLFHGLFWFLAMSIMNPSIKPYPFPFHHVDFNNHDNHAGLDQWSTKQCFKLLGFFMIWWFPLPEQVVPTGNEEHVIEVELPGNQWSERWKPSMVAKKSIYDQLKWEKVELCGKLGPSLEAINGGSTNNGT